MYVCFSVRLISRCGKVPDTCATSQNTALTLRDVTAGGEKQEGSRRVGGDAYQRANVTAGKDLGQRVGALNPLEAVNTGLTWHRTL